MNLSATGPNNKSIAKAKRVNACLKITQCDTVYRGYTVSAFTTFHLLVALVARVLHKPVNVLDLNMVTANANPFLNKIIGSTLFPGLIDLNILLIRKVEV